MAASPVLADSSFYIRSLRERRDPLQELALAAATREVAVCGVVCCEVGRAIRNEAALAKFHRAWGVMRYVPTDNSLWAEVERQLWELDRRGTVISLPDMIIACSARRIGAQLLSYDEAFDLIPGVRRTSKLDY